MTRVDPATAAFFTALSGLEKAAVDLSTPTRAALEFEADPDTLDALESAAGGPGAEREGTPLPAPPEAETIAPNVQIAAAPPPHDEEPALEQGDDEAAAAAPPLPGRATHGSIFSARRTHPLELNDVLWAKYGQDWLIWEPTTLWWAVRRDFGPVGELTRNKVMALRVATNTYRPWSEWDTFEKCGLAWNDILPVFGAWQPMPPSHVAFTIEVLRALHPEAPWTHEVAAYEAMILDDSGFVYAPPEWFPGAQVLLDRNPSNAAFRDEVASTWAKLAGQDLSKAAWRADSARDIHLARLYVVASYLASRAALRRGDAERGRAQAASASTSPPVP